MSTPDSPPPAITQFDISVIEQPEAFAKLPGYYISSTAAINIEDNPLPPENTLVLNKMSAIADYLVASSERQVVISIHGYGTQRTDAQRRYQKIHKQAATICKPGTSIFLGYLWPSEKPTGDSALHSSLWTKLQDAVNALPTLLGGIISVSFISSLITAILLFRTNDFNDLLTPILIVSILAFTTVFVLILLRLSTYFRDNYRATNYGVLDLVELIRRLDQAVVEKLKLDPLHKLELDSQDKIIDKEKRIKLSFIGHSMGCFVVTNTIRILSDVFDPGSIAQNPPADIGRVFSLGRLVLVAPDIPTESIMPRRANFLRSSLRRCEEAYVFSNEGDLALRLASTTANYFSFPARERSSGYRLGNITAKHFRDEKDHQKRQLAATDYGIINRKDGKPPESPSEYLEVRASDREHQTLNELRDYNVQKEKVGTAQEVVLADLFTYFDCTDYIDRQDDLKPSETNNESRGVVSFARKKAALDLWGYVWLNLSYFKQSFGLGGVNVHGGYFSGIWSQKLIYGLAFLGFQTFLCSPFEETVPKTDSTNAVSLDAVNPDPENPDVMKQRLDQLAEKCQHRGIQVVLAPIRYKQNILGIQPSPTSQEPPV